MTHTPETAVKNFIASLIKHSALSAQQGSQFAQNYPISLDPLIELLMTDGIVTRRDVLVALSDTYQVPWFDVTGYFFDHQLVHLFPKGFLLRHGAVPLMIDEDELIVVVADPAEQDLLPAFGAYVSYDIQFQVGIRRHIEDAVKEFYDESVVYDIPADEDSEAERRLAREETELEEDELEKLRDFEE